MTIEHEDERPASVLPRTVQTAVVLLSLVALGSALASVLALVSALRWAVSDGEVYVDESGRSQPLVAVVATLAYTKNWLGAILPVAGLVAVVVLLGLSVTTRGRRIGSTWRRRVGIVVLAAVGVHFVVGLTHVVILAVGWWVADSETAILFLAGTPFVGGLQVVSRDLLDVLLWGALLALVIAATRGGWPAEADDPRPPEGEDAVPEEPVPTPSVTETPPVPVEGPDPARLRADGSSDSGYDEFRFRR